LLIEQKDIVEQLKIFRSQAIFPTIPYQVGHGDQFQVNLNAAIGLDKLPLTPIFGVRVPVDFFSEPPSNNLG
jgi:hypothetical protein